MYADTAVVLAEPAIKKRLEDLGLFVIGSTPEQLGQYLKAEMDKWGPIIKEAGISIHERDATSCAELPMASGGARSLPYENKSTLLT